MEDGDGVGAAGAAGGSRAAHPSSFTFWALFAAHVPPCPMLSWGRKTAICAGHAVLSAAQLPLAHVGDRCHAEHAWFQLY